MTALSASPRDVTMDILRAKGGNQWFWILEWIYARDPDLVARGWAALTEDQRARAEASRKRRNRKRSLASRQRRKAAA